MHRDRPIFTCVLMLGLILSLGSGGSATSAEPRPTAPPPTLPARSYILVDSDSGAVIAEKDADLKVEPASLTKMMTVYTVGHALASGLVALTDPVTVSEKAWKMGGSRMFVEVGSQVSVNDLLQGVIVQSGNDASVALAEHVSGSEEVFASVMTEHARVLGMQATSFSNATGWPDAGTYTTARDLATLAAALLREFPDLYARFSAREFTWNDITQPNRNRLLYRDESVDGIKTGHTEAAGYCLVASAKRGEMRLIAAVMGTASDDARTEASAALLNYGFRFFETRRLYEADAKVATARVWRGKTDEVELGVAAPVALTIPRGRYDDLKAVAHLEEPITAPLAAGDAVGRMEVSLDGEIVLEVPLVALGAVPEGSFFSRLYDGVMLLFE